MIIIRMVIKSHKMFDIHSHIIPRIDDGARDEADALSLLRLAQQDGTTHIVATPHIHSGRFENDQNTIFAGLSTLKKIIKEHSLTINVAASCELRLDIVHMAKLMSGEIPTLGTVNGYKIVLLEFPHSHIPPGAENFVKWLFNNGYKPIIAHPERNRDLLKSPSLLNPYLRLGCLTQVTAGSITGEFGNTVKSYALSLLAQDKVDVIASDAHNISRRPPVLSKAYALVTKEFGVEKADTLFKITPQKLTQTLFDEG
ncbi:capsule biosynthesis protein CapC [Pseudoalteromonas sp. KS88]|uniref:tyrosine-protein phosphatase n=1 Tax=Pseudoalteromonas sp. KS88 TaxID=2109918 RepID=UPI0010822A60|nr:CpsB/CapC family capsule biosynthesis tyrosine phosphatase [Pseudoalteromonas sp. KS88]TGE83946.1 capsule biosynthesis protein CapC [Pseudoalteromonas sp. KS88]